MGLLTVSKESALVEAANYVLTASVFLRLAEILACAPADSMLTSLSQKFGASREW